MWMLGRKRQSTLLRDLVAAEKDIVALAAAHRLTLEQLVTWSQQEETQRRLAALRALADAQAQLMLSRYRLHAVGRLVQLATQETDDERARRSCVDLLKVDLWQGGEGAAEDDPTAVMRSLLAAPGLAPDPAPGSPGRLGSLGSTFAVARDLEGMEGGDDVAED